MTVINKAAEAIHHLVSKANCRDAPVLEIKFSSIDDAIRFKHVVREDIRGLLVIDTNLENKKFVLYGMELKITGEAP